MSADTPTKESVLFKKILVALDASSHSMAALENAARLAERLEAELHGLFVEDADWFALSQLSTTSEISELTGTLRRLEKGDMERHVMSLATRLRQSVEELSRRHRIKHHFETKRGKVDRELLEAARNADLITFGRLGHSMWGGPELGTTARTLIQKSETPVLILQQGIQIGGPITIVYLDEQDKRILKIGAALAGRLDVDVDVIAFTESKEEKEQQDQFIQQVLDTLNQTARIHTLSYPNVHELTFLIRNLRSGMLISSRRCTLLSDENLEHTLSGIRCPVLLI